MSTSSTLLRLVLVTGSRRRDLAVTPQARLADVLHSTGIDATAAVVTTSWGTKVDLRAPLAQEVRDGAVLSVVDTETPATAPRPADPPARYRRLPAGTGGWVVCALGIALCLVIVASHVAALGTGGPPYPPWWQYTAPVLLGGTGVLLALRRAPLARGRATDDGERAPGRDRRVAQAADDGGRARVRYRRADQGLLDETVLAPVFGLAAGFLVAQPDQYGALRLAVVLGLLSGAVLSVARYAVSRREQAPSTGIAAVLAGVWTAVAALFATALLLDLPTVVVPALILGAVPLLIRALPSAALDIPEEQVLDMPFLARTALSVRGVLPPSPSRVRREQVSGRVRLAEHRERAGVICASVLVVVMTPVVLSGYQPGGLRGWGTVALVAMLVLFLALAPRSFRRPADKLPPRLALFTVLGQLAVAAVQFPDLLVWTVVVIVVALGCAFLAVPLARGYRSVRFSRIGDILEAITVGLVLPAALLAAGAVEGLQTLTAR